MIEANSVLQNRIAIDAMNKNVFVSADEKMKWLLQEGILLDVTYKHEVFQLIKNHFALSLENKGRSHSNCIKGPCGGKSI